MFFVMKKLIEYTPSGCDLPVAYVSDNLPDYVLRVIDNNYDKISSGLGNHYSVDELTSIQQQELIDEYNEEYALANAY